MRIRYREYSPTVQSRTPVTKKCCVFYNAQYTPPTPANAIGVIHKKHTVSRLVFSVSRLVIKCSGLQQQVRDTIPWERTHQMQHVHHPSTSGRVVFLRLDSPRVAAGGMEEWTADTKEDNGSSDWHSGSDVIHRHALTWAALMPRGG